MRHPETRKAQITAVAFLFTQIQKITIYSLWERRKKPHLFQLWQLHRSQWRADMQVPAWICWRTVRCFTQQVFVEQFFQKGPESNGHRGFAPLQKYGQSSYLSSTVPCWSDFEGLKVQQFYLDKNHKLMQQDLIQYSTINSCARYYFLDSIVHLLLHACFFDSMPILYMTSQNVVFPQVGTHKHTYPAYI